MLHKDFFRLILKLFGLYALVICLFTFLPGTITQLWGFGELTGLLLGLCILAIPVLLFLLLLFRHDIIIRWLRLDQGFDEERINFGDLSSANILKLGSIITGGFLIIDSIPLLLNDTLFIFKASLAGKQDHDKIYLSWGINFVKITLGYLLIRNHEFVSKLLRTRSE
ncbi:MAG: hypothetical protein M3R17_13320 [Bacteroidota bacterium]|nr:hypothetical protein [Bacteroidota bacterium]